MSVTAWKCAARGGPGAREPCGVGSAADPEKATRIWFERNRGPLSCCEPSPGGGLAIAIEDRTR